MLRVDALVEGSVMRENNRIRVTVQLIRGSTDEHFWSETYDRELRDVLNVQSELAQAIARKVEVSITGEEHDRLAAARSVAPEVYESYLKGRYTLDKSHSRAALEESVAYFDRAIQMDATFAPAYLGVANADAQLGTVFIGAPPSETRPRALELNPNDADAHAQLALWLLCQGRTDEAVSWVRRGRELDPLTVSGNWIGWILFQSHRYDDAIRELRSSLRVEPNNAGVLTSLGFALVANDQPEEAITVLQKAISVSKRSPAASGVLVRAYAHAGRREDALRLLAQLQERRRAGYIPAGAFVNAYLGLDDTDQAFAWLEQAYKEQSNILQFLKVHPYFDPIRGDARVVSLVDRVGLG